MTLTETLFNDLNTLRDNVDKFQRDLTSLQNKCTWAFLLLEQISETPNVPENLKDYIKVTLPAMKP
jgi:uncharacterized protein (UPF0147 family)